MKRNVRKLVALMTAMVLLFMTVLPMPTSNAAAFDLDTLNDSPSAWPATYSPYSHINGGFILDPAGEPGISPIDVDITSGVDKGVGNLPSVYVASDSTNLFVRLRLKGDPYDRKGGFLSSVWLVQVGVNGVHKATVGLNGKSPSEDYVYIANASGTVVQPIYKTSVPGGNSVPGTRIITAENGQYFLDFQVPISRITGVAPEVTPSTPVQLFFASSKAANLSVVNKDGMNESNTPAFTGQAVPLNAVPPSILINGGVSKDYINPNLTMAGSFSAVQGSTVSIVINGTSYNPLINWTNKTWTLSLSSLNGFYTAAAKVTEPSGANAAASQEIYVKDSSLNQITIDGGAVRAVNTATPLISGTVVGPNGSKVSVSVNGTVLSGNVNAGAWSVAVPLGSALSANTTYTIVATHTNSSGNTTYGSATQKLTYTQNAVTALSVGIGTIAGGALPTIPGTSTGASLVEVQVDDTTVGIAAPLANGTWSISLERPLSPGSHTVKAIAINSYGSIAVDSKAHNVLNTVISIDNGADAVTNDREPTIRGNTNASNGSKVTVEINNLQQGLAYEASALNGRWSIEVNSLDSLSDGVYTVTATVNGTSSTQLLTVDTTTFVTIESPEQGSQVSALQPVISGTAEPLATLDLNINEDVVVITTTANIDGNWSVQPAEPLEQGLVSLQVTASDVHGNDEQTTGSFTIQGNNTPPVAQAVDITGKVKVGETLTGVYAYVDAEGDLEDDSVFMWYRGTSNDGADKTAIAGATEQTYVVDESDLGSYLFFEVSPKAVTGAAAGLAVLSSASVLVTGDNNNASVTGTVYSSTGGVVSGVKVNVRDEQGYLGSTITNVEGQFLIESLPPVAATLYVENSQRTLISGEITLIQDQEIASDLYFMDIASLILEAAPQQLIGDGKAKSALKATLTYKEDNTPVIGADVVFSTTAGKLSDTVVVTNDSGRAGSTLTAPKIVGINGLSEEAAIVVRDLESGVFAEKTVQITFLPASIEGIVTINGKPVQGAQVTIEEDLGAPIGLYTVTAVSGADGSYNLVVPLGDRAYTVKVRTSSQIEGQTVILEFEQRAVIGNMDDDEEQAVYAISQISGKLFLKNNIGKNIRTILGEKNEVNAKIYNAQGDLLNKEVIVEPDGRFKVEQLTPGTYRLLFQLSVDGQRLAGVWRTVTISSEGEIAIEPALIDPYGVVKDAMTEMPIPGVNTQLYWADTPLNLSLGRTPGALVTLPILDDFAPNQNKNPQITTSSGEYGWMVYANGDYYLTGTKEGYLDYDSRDEKRTVPVAEGEDSYITDGIIHVGESIVEYDFSMNAEQPLSDDEAIREALKNLRVEYSDTDIWESVTKQAFLVKDGLYSTVVSWRSSNEDVFKISESAEALEESQPRKFIADVNRKSEDVSVILTATVSKGDGTPLSRTFLLIVKSTEVNEQKVTEARSDSSVIVNGQDMGMRIDRTTLSNNKRIDKLVVEGEKVSQLLQINGSASELRINFNDKPNNDSSQRADELAIEIPITAIEGLSQLQRLEVATPEGSVALSADSLAKVRAAGFDLFFRIVPIRDQNKQKVITERVRREISSLHSLNDITILDIPREIEANYTGYETEVTLPLTNVTLPSGTVERQRYLDLLRVYIEHTDGTNEVIGKVGANPGIIVYSNGIPTGIKFKVTTFSTFTMFMENEALQPSNPIIPPAAVSPVAITVTTAEANIGEGSIQLDLSGSVNYFDEKAFTILIAGQPAEIAKVERIQGNQLRIIMVKPIPSGHMITVKYNEGLAGLHNQFLSLPSFENNILNADIHYKYINGYPDGTFKPGNPITRAEMAAMLTRLLNRDREYIPTATYSDVSSQHWASSNIEVMGQTGIMQGYQSGAFRPEQPITRGEFAAVVLRFLNTAEIKSHMEYSFNDISTHWARNEIETVKGLGIMVGANGLFHPNRNLSRNEAVTTLNRILNRGALTGEFLPSWPDVTRSNWGFGQVEEASRTHEATRITENEEQWIRFID